MADKKIYAAPQPLGAEVKPSQAQLPLPTTVVAGWDPRTGYYHALNLGCLVEPQVLAERLHATDKLDTRNGVTVEIPNGAAVGSAHSGVITVPAGEVWFINRLQVICPAADATGSASFNILVSSWPKVAGVDKGYFAAAQVAMGATTNVDLPAQGELGEELRLKGGDVLTLALVVTVAHTADKDYVLNVFGRKGKAIIPQG